MAIVKRIVLLRLRYLKARRFKREQEIQKSQKKRGQQRQGGRMSLDETLTPSAWESYFR